MTFDEVQDELVQWLNLVTGVQVIAARQGIDRPATPYMVVEKQSFAELFERPSDLKWKELTSTNTAGLLELEATPVSDVEWTFFVYAYGDGSDVHLQKVKSAFHLSQMTEPMIPTLTIHETGVMNSIPEFIDETWEPRFQMNIMVRGLSESGHVVDTIETVTPFDIQRTQ